MESQIASMFPTTHLHLRRIAQLCPYLDTEYLTTLVHALVVLRFNPERGLENSNQKPGLLSGSPTIMEYSPAQYSLSAFIGNL